MPPQFILVRSVLSMMSPVWWGKEGSLNDQQWMEKALELAARAKGRTSPNPMVGAVIVANGREIGAGYHRQAGGPHAEIEALRHCTQSPVGATMYVTLEPCCHHGKTPPCAEALIEAKLARVVYASPDPNPLVDGGGHRRLQAAGIDVRGGVLAEVGNGLNRAFFHYIRAIKPYVTAKFAMSLDGKIATASGESQWISSPASRLRGHQLRNQSDAILVGTNTVLADDPRLTTRLPDTSHVRHPLRVVIDARGRIPLHAQVFNPELPGETVLAHGPHLDVSLRETLTARGIDTLSVPVQPHGGLDLDRLLEALAKRGIMNLMVEGGGTLLGALLMQGLIQEVWGFVCPQLIGGAAAPSPFAGMGFQSLDDAARLENLEVEPMASDYLFRAQVRYPAAERAAQKTEED